MKSLSDRQNQRQPILSPEHGYMTGKQEYQTKYLETEGGEENQEETCDSASEHKTHKIQRIELQGEFHKIKLPLFDGEQEEGDEAVLINVNMYFQRYG